MDFDRTLSELAFDGVPSYGWLTIMFYTCILQGFSKPRRRYEGHADEFTNRLRCWMLICAAGWLPFVGWAQSANADTAAPTSSAETASRVVEDGGTGPYKALMASDKSLATHTVFRPMDLSTLGDTVKLPIVVWGNGACANSPWEHVNFLSEVASHGFLVIAIGSMPSEGQRGAPGGPTKSPMLLDAIHWAMARNNDKFSQYYQKLDTNKIAVAGMSCGGLQALEVALDPRISTAMICNSGLFSDPASSRFELPRVGKEQLAKLHAPTIYILGGEKDIAYKNGMDDFKRINHVPVFAANLNVGHGGTYSQPHGGEFATVATAWLQWQLKNDQEAARMFTGDPCGLANAEGWKVEKKNIP